MRTLIQFFINNLFYFIFAVLITFSIALMVNFNDFQRSVFFNSTNRIVGQMHSLTSTVAEYFGLREQNERLLNANADLMRRILVLESRLEATDYTQFVFTAVSPEKDFSFLPAKVINNSTRSLHNYMTLNRGYRDGVQVGMGVVSEQGIVGIVHAVSKHFSVVTSVLNPKIRFSCKFKRNNFMGLLSWNGRDYRFAQFENIPIHVHVEVGDTIVTTGFRFDDFNEGFPENTPVGIVESFEINASTANYNIEVRLFTNFNTLRHVKIIGHNHRVEQATLERNLQ